MGERFAREIENEGSSTNVVVEADAGGLSMSLEPMDAPVWKIDVYEEELEDFREAIDDAIAFVEAGDG